MTINRWLFTAFTAVAPASVLAQAAQMAPRPLPNARFTAAPGGQYGNAALPRFLAGGNWRSIWIDPVTVPILDLGSFAGGLTPTEAGGNQSRTLRFKGQDGRTWIFRSTDKFLDKALPEDIAGTPIGALIQDQTSSLHPYAGLVAAPLHSAVGLLYAKPQLVIMPDDPRLGEFRQKYAGLIGQIEERPDEIAEGVKPFAGADKFIGSPKLLAQLEASSKNHFAAREYLTARLLDFMIGDLDRGADQWRWAGFDQGEVRVWRPLARDRDYAFMRSTGLLGRLVSTVYPKVTRYDKSFPSLRGLTFMTAEFDRSHLVGLTRASWDSAVSQVQTSLSDAVIAEAVSQLPVDQRESADRIAAGLRARRARLARVTAKYYDLVNREADIFGSNEAEQADIERNQDGSVTVRMRGATGTFFDRSFSPAETKEIRIYLQDGADRATVRGSGSGITVRVIGGAGDDELIDTSSGGQTAFYDASGINRIERSPSTRVSTREFEMLQPATDEDEDEPWVKPSVEEERRGRFTDLLNEHARTFINSKIKGATDRFWGEKDGFGPRVDYREGAGPIVGVGYTTTQYAFRHRPWQSRLGIAALYGLEPGGFGAEARADLRRENSPFGLALFARASQFESNRFYGLGNDSPLIDSDAALVMRDEVTGSLALTWSPSNDVLVGVGPVVRFLDGRRRAGSPAAMLFPAASQAQGQIGAQLEANLDGRGGSKLPRSGYQFHAIASTWPAALDVTAAFSRIEADGAVYVPAGPFTVALRSGATRVFGDFPLHEAAFLGGRQTLRGFRWNRFTGDAEVHGAAQLHLPLGRIELLTSGNVGVYGLADAGRVWFEGESAGRWHRGFGGGITFESLSNLLSAGYATGEQGRFYVQLGTALPIR